MKKFLTLMIALALILTGSALAENVPAPRFAGTETEQTETAEQEAEETAAPADPADPAEYVVPEGKIAYQYMLQMYDYKGFMIGDWSFSDTVQATDAAEKSVRIPASKGNQMLDVKYVLRINCNVSHKPLNEFEISCTIVDGNGREYPSSMWIESSANAIYEGASNHKTVDTNNHENAYLIPIDGVSEQITNSHVSDDRFILFDCIAEIPEEMIGTELPLYIVIHNMGETDYYVRIQ